MMGITDWRREGGRSNVFLFVAKIHEISIPRVRNKNQCRRVFSGLLYGVRSTNGTIKQTSAFHTEKVSFFLS